MTIMPFIAPREPEIAVAHPLKIEARKAIFEEGDPSHHIYEIASGVVMTYKLLPDGRRQIFEILRHGDFIGVSHAPAYGHGAQTLSKCQLRRFNKVPFLGGVPNQARLLQFMIDRREAHYAHALVLGRKSAAERITLFFAEFGGNTLADTELHISLREMSDYLGLRPETVSRQVASLCKASLISRSRWGTYRVKDHAGLQALANAICSKWNDPGNAEEDPRIAASLG